jgi:hypothetical protein
MPIAIPSVGTPAYRYAQNWNPSYRRVALISVRFPNHAEGAPGPSHLGTGDGGAALPKPPPVRVFSLFMKGERIRYQQTGEFHFLTFSCFRRRRVAQVPGEVSTATEDGWPRCLAFGHLG